MVESGPSSGKVPGANGATDTETAEGLFRPVNLRCVLATGCLPEQYSQAGKFTPSPPKHTPRPLLPQACKIGQTLNGAVGVCPFLLPIPVSLIVLAHGTWILQNIA